MAKLVRAAGTTIYPLLLFKVAPPTGKPWPEELPSSHELLEFYRICDGGRLSHQYDWLPQAKLAQETEHWRKLLHNYRGDGADILLRRHVVVATDAGDMPVVWDAESDQLASFFWKGGDWEPLDCGFNAFMKALFFDPSRVFAGSTPGCHWVKSLQQLERMEP